MSQQLQEQFFRVSVVMISSPPKDNIKDNEIFTFIFKKNFEYTFFFRIEVALLTSTLNKNT